MPELTTKRAAFPLFLLWMVMQSNYVNLYIGISAAHSQASFTTAISALLFSTILYTIYGLIAGMNGAVTGKKLVDLAEDEFGRVGSALAGAIIVIVPSAWYCFNSVVTADVLILLIPEFSGYKPLIVSFLVVTMAFNNLFGFSGILKFAQYIAAPLLLAGVVVALSSGNLTGKTNTDATAPVVLFDMAAFQLICFSLLGNATWGNEEDFWRHARPTLRNCILPIIAANFIGLFLLGIAGYLGAPFLPAKSDLEALRDVTLLMGFGSATLAAALAYLHIMAINDSNMFSALNGLEAFFNQSRRRLAVAMIPFLLLLAYAFQQIALIDLLFMIAGFCGTILPSLGLTVWCSRKVAATLPLPQRKIGFCIALLLGVFVGVITSAPGSLVPGVGLSIGLSVIQAWVTTLLVYFLYVRFRLYQNGTSCA